MKLLAHTSELITAAGWRATYVDATIVAQKPTLGPFVKQMGKAMSASLDLTADSINVKAKTTDGLGFTGRGEGITAMAVATLESIK
jgi:2-C-methyl-D-erythritol 2,4-cyclodiphosphate synthase